ncbi:MAG: hypothetical protein ABEJ57_01010 [Halobacteriaceae archaeon]
MASAESQELIDKFDQFYRRYYADDIADLARNYPTEKKSLTIDWTDLFQYDPDLADDLKNQPGQIRDYAEEALRLYDLPVDVSLGQAHVRVQTLDGHTQIRDIRSQHINTLVSIQGMVRKATDVRPKITEAAFECQRCGTLNRIPQAGGFQEPHECQGCERQGPFEVNVDQSEFIDAQKLRIQESPEGLRGGETPQGIDIHVEDDLAGTVTPGDHVTATGVLHLDQQERGGEKTAMYDIYMDGWSLAIEDEEFENMEITDEDKARIVDLSQSPGIYEQIVGAIAPSIYGFDEEKLAMALQLFSGVTKHLPDGSRTRGDLHILLIGDPGTGKCLAGDTPVTLADGRQPTIRDLVEANLEDPTPVDDGVYDDIDVAVPSLHPDGTITTRRATRVWKREAPDTMYHIRTAAGRTLEVTPSHPLFRATEDVFEPVPAEDFSVGDRVATTARTPGSHARTDGGVHATRGTPPTSSPTDITVEREELVAIDLVEPEEEWVYDLEVEGTHNYLSNGVVSHNSALLQYIGNIAPRSVYTSGKGSSAAGLTAAAVRDDFGDGQQWTLEAGALVLADKGIAAVDELDKMRCVVGETTVQTTTGPREIQDIADAAATTGTIEDLENGRTIRGADLSVWTMAQDALVQRPVTAVHEYDAPDTLYEVELNTGATVKATPDHPFVVRDDGDRLQRPAEDLAVGDRVPVPETIPPAATDGGLRTADASSTVEAIRWGTVTSVDPVAATASSKVYDLTVEGTHNFVANGMVVHNSEDRSAMHQALEQQEISISKAGINATLKSRCSLLGAANPKYGRFDQYEPLGEQIDLEPALISRFDLIFTVSDQPDEEEDAELAEHILQTNYAGELNTHHEEVAASAVSQEEVDEEVHDVAPTIDPQLLRKYIAHAKSSIYPTMSEDARERIREFYVDLRALGQGEDSPVPVTARQLEALVRLAEASARVRLSDTVTKEDADRVIDIVRSSLEDIGVDPETGEFDADVVEVGTSKSQRDRIKNLRGIIGELEDEYEDGAPIEEVLDRAEELGTERSKAEHEIEKLKQKGEVYQPSQGHLRTT